MTDVGVMLAKPNAAIYDELISMWYDPKYRSSFRSEQDLLNTKFTPKLGNMHVLPEEYGPFVERCHCAGSISPSVHCCMICLIKVASEGDPIQRFQALESPAMGDVQKLSRYLQLSVLVAVAASV